MENCCLLLLQDEKADGKKDGDIEMKAEDGAVEESKASTSTKRKAEPSSEKIANFSRVTPVQLGYISFPPDGRYQPVRPVSLNMPFTKNGKGTSMPAGKRGTGPSGLVSERYAGGGGILILVDERPDEEAEIIDLSPSTPVTGTANGSAVPNGHANPAASERNFHIALDESTSDADPPESFEVCGDLVP